MKRLRWLITVPLALILVVFAINNRHLVDVSLWPLDFVVRWPLFVFVYVGVLAGFVAGAVIAWTSALQRGRRARRREAGKSAQADPAKRKPATADGATATPPALTD